MKNSLKLFTTLLLLTISTITTAQIAINADGASPDASAMLEITSSDKGLLIPRMDSTSRKNIASPATGLLVFDTDENSFWYYANSTWINLSEIIIADADGDTKIQVEESTDEDIIRFDLGGTEFMKLDNGRIEVLNTGGSVFLGEGAGENDGLTNNSNVFIGTKAGYSNITGYQNVFTGNYAGYNTTGDANTFTGYGSGISSTTGNNNTFIGHYSGRYNETGSNNTFLGYGAGYHETGSNKLYISNSTTTTPLIYGEFDNGLLQINGTLNINGAFAFPTTDGDSTQVLMTDGSGTVTWSDLNISSLVDADGDTKIQVEESADEDIIRFDIAGTEKLVIKENSTGLTQLEFFNNYNSIFLGEGAGENTEGGSVGGNNNNFIGYQAGYSNQYGYGNLALGYQTGYSNTTGGWNIFLGYQAGYSETGSNKLYISNSNTTTPLIYGEFDNDLLQINGDLEITGDLDANIINASGGTVQVNDDTEITGTLEVSDTLTSHGVFTVDKTVGGINAYIAELSNTNNSSNAYNNVLNIIGGGTSYNSSRPSFYINFRTPDGTSIGSITQASSSSISFNTTSDIRLKENIEPTAYGISDILNIQVSDYNYKSDQSRTPQTGFIAQQLNTIYPIAVTEGGDDAKANPWTVDYSKLTPLLVKGMQEQQEEIELLKKENEKLKADVAKINELEAMLQQLQSQVNNNTIPTNKLSEK